MAFIEWTGYKSVTRTHMKENEISINSKKGNWSITINQAITKVLVAKGISRVSFYQDDTTGIVAMVFFNEGRVKLTPTGREQSNYTISNKSIVNWLVGELGLKGERNIVKISENKSVRDDRCFYEFIKR